MTYFLFTLSMFFNFFLSADLALSHLDKCHLEIFEEQKIIYLSGTPYEIGYQHGTLLKQDILDNINRFIEPMSSSSAKNSAVISYFKEALPKIIPHIPLALIEEMQGLADGTQIPFNKILLLNLFPEMFHCTGITVGGEATANEDFYHIRVLDYCAGNGLQHTAVLAIVEPDTGYPFLNVTYAGFIGCVTGMNIKKIAIGEIGGKGYGYWEGIPMAFLLRMIVQQTSSLDEIKDMLTNVPRTCEYYYLFSDGNTGNSLAAYATPTILTFFRPGEKYPKYTPLKNTFETEMIVPTNPLFLENSTFNQPKDILMISRGDHFDLLKERLLKNYGTINLYNLQEAIKQPIAHPANLHNAIFAPITLDIWLSHAGKNNEPACDQPYHHFNLSNLLENKCLKN